MIRSGPILLLFAKRRMGRCRRPANPSHPERPKKSCESSPNLFNKIPEKNIIRAIIDRGGVRSKSRPRLPIETSFIDCG